MTIVLFVYFCLLFSLLSFMVIRLIATEEKGMTKLTAYPKVSILVAARNEESCIVNCLTAIAGLKYPADKIEVLIGDDGSEDKTAMLVEKFIRQHDNFRLIKITEQIGNTKGKANVLAHLANEATGEVLFITDADTEVAPTWIQGMLAAMDKGIGMVSGVTVTRGKGIWPKLQTLEWAQGFGFIKVFSDLNVPVTAVGNNMAVTRQAYDSTGGYQNIPFSLTEDFALFKHTLQQGWKFKNLLNPSVLGYTQPIKGFMVLLRQRKRWLTGASQLPWFIVCAMAVPSLFFPFILITLWNYPEWGALVWMIKILFYQIYVSLVLQRINVWPGILKYALLFEIYSGILSFSVLVYNFLPTGIEWKGRKY